MNALTNRGLPRRRNYPANRVPNSTPGYDRILRYVREDENGCWIWTAAIDATSGYGRIQMDGASRYAHRVAYEAFVADIPAGLEIDHLCRNRACCNPFGHLEPVTPQINVRRGMSTGARALRRGRCVHGHAYPENARVHQGRTHCIECNRVRCRIYQAMTPEQRAARKAAGLQVVDLAAYFANQSEEIAA